MNDLTAKDIEYLRRALPVLIDPRYAHSEHNHAQSINALCDAALRGIDQPTQKSDAAFVPCVSCGLAECVSQGKCIQGYQRESAADTAAGCDLANAGQRESDPRLSGATPGSASGQSDFHHQRESAAPEATNKVDNFPSAVLAVATQSDTHHQRPSAAQPAGREPDRSAETKKADVVQSEGHHSERARDAITSLVRRLDAANERAKRAEVERDKARAELAPSEPTEEMLLAGLRAYCGTPERLPDSEKHGLRAAYRAMIAARPK